MKNKLLLPELHTEGFSLDALLENGFNGIEYIRDKVLDTQLELYKKSPEDWRREQCEQIQDALSYMTGLISEVQTVYQEMIILKRMQEATTKYKQGFGTKYTLTITYDLENADPKCKVIPYLIPGIIKPLPR